MTQTSAIVVALLIPLVVLLSLILFELRKIRAALGAFAVLRQRGAVAFGSEVKPTAQRSLFESSLQFPKCD